MNDGFSYRLALPITSMDFYKKIESQMDPVNFHRQACCGRLGMLR